MTRQLCVNKTYLRCANLANVQLSDDVVLDVNLDDDPQVLHGILHPLSGQFGQVDLHPAPGVQPELDRVLLGWDEGHLAALVHRDILDVDDGFDLCLGWGLGKMNVEYGLQYCNKMLSLE